MPTLTFAGEQFACAPDLPPETIEALVRRVRQLDQAKPRMKAARWEKAMGAAAAEFLNAALEPDAVTRNRFQELASVWSGDFDSELRRACTQLAADYDGRR